MNMVGSNMLFLGTLVVLLAVFKSKSADSLEGAHLEVKLQEVLDRIAVLEETVAEKSEVIDQQAETIKKLQRYHEISRTSMAGYAFSAYIDRVVTDLAPNQPVPFNKVLMNRGLVFNLTTGKFICPVDGLYFFTFSLENDASGHFVSKLIVDGENQINAVNGQYQNAGNSVVVGLKTGQAVWVAINGGNTTIWNSDKYRYSSFTGISLP